MKRYWTVIYYLLKDQDIPVTEHFATRKEARRFKKALKLADTYYTGVSLHKTYIYPYPGCILISPNKEY